MDAASAPIAIIGPTASGKSSLALHLALGQPGREIISVDAFAVYRGMDIGTATPSAAVRAQVRHHLINLVPATAEFSVMDFRTAYHQVRADLAARGGRAVLVGGTGLYHRVVVDDLEPPGRWPDIRAGLEAELAEQGAPSLHARLAALDPVAAARMEPSNARRVVRALEVCLGSGRPFSSYGPGLETYGPNPVIQIGLRWPMDLLTERIRTRVAEMIAAGWVAEVEALEAAGGLSRTASQAVGYAEIDRVRRGEIDLDTATEMIVLRTRQLAVRQLRWFRRDPRIRWVDVSSDPVTDAAEVLAEVCGN